jgi:hypothetical protein
VLSAVGQVNLELAGNVAGNVGLHLRKVGQFSFGVRTPDLRAVRGIHQVGLNAESVTMLCDPAHQHCADLQGLTDFLRIV